MSLFPAYGDNPLPEKNSTKESSKEDLDCGILKNSTPDVAISKTWKENASFSVQAAEHLTALVQAAETSAPDNESVSSSSSRNSSPEPETDISTAQYLAKLSRLEFDSTDEFYVDKKRNTTFNGLKSLSRLSRPRYNTVLKRLNNPLEKRFAPKARAKSKHSWNRLMELERLAAAPKFSEEDIIRKQERIGKLKKLVFREPNCLAHWIELHELLSHNLDKSNRLAVAESQLYFLENALMHNRSNEALMQLYVRTASATYPASQVATKLEQLLEKDPFEYTLWTALIMTTQGTLERCNVPGVLHIYEQSMSRMHLGYSDQPTTLTHKSLHVDTDGIMLKLFHNCVLFMRQSSNNCQAFALLKLALEINLPGLTFDCFEANAADERALIDYEELVLQSGLPMPEIWKRIELLRQAFNFLPYPLSNSYTEDIAGTGLDPQRCIYNSDVCHYIYPLKSPNNNLHLLLLAVQLTKLPFVRTNSLAERLCARIDQIGDSDDIEMMLAGLGDRFTYVFPLNQESSFNNALLDFAKEMCVVPTFMPHSIGHELYAKLINALLLKCSEAFLQPPQEPKRRVLILLWFRFQRIQLVLRKLSGNLTEQYLREARLGIRKIMRSELNRQVTRYYTELGMFEYEALDSKDTDESYSRIFENIINSQVDSDSSYDDVDVMHAFIVYSEMLIARGNLKHALHVLTTLALKRRATSSSAVIELQREKALENNMCMINAEIELQKAASASLPLEDYFLSNKLLLLLRLRCLMLCMLGQSSQASDLLQQVLTEDLVQSDGSNHRLSFLREQLLELRLIVLQLSFTALLPTVLSKKCAGNPLVSLLESALTEFPRNLAMLQRCATLVTVPWHQLRARLIRTKAGILSLVHMILAGRCRFLNTLQQSEDMHHMRSHMEAVVRNRILWMFETFLPTNTNRSAIEASQYEVLRRNSLYWRCYLRCLSDQSTSFDDSNKCLLTALDECPWGKALYMDGAVYVPQELTHLQDLMTEKQIRIYAIPEELDILRAS